MKILKSDLFEELPLSLGVEVSFFKAAALPFVLLSTMVLAVSFWLPLWVGLSLVIVYLVWQLAMHYREIRLFALWLTHPNSRNVPSGHGVWTDIFAKLYLLRRTDEKHEAQLAEWLERFQNTMRHLPDGIVLMDKSTAIEWINPVAEQHFKLIPRRDLGTRLMNLVREPIFATQIEQESWDVPFKFMYFGNHLEIRVIEFEANRLILVSRDVSEVERVDAMRRDFIANASHELRTPLTVISGFLEHAQEEPEMDAEIRERQLTLMRQQAERMTILIQDMLMLSRLESDVLVEVQALNMPELIQQQLDNARALSNGRHTFESNVADVHIQGSEQEIASVVGNLLSNAVRYTPEGGTISIQWNCNQHQQAQLTIRDTGDGIAPEHIPRLTERFYRVNTAQSRATKGTGLGLAIVKHVLIRHHASLHIDSIMAPAHGHGTAFRVVFPEASGRGCTLVQI